VAAAGDPQELLRQRTRARLVEALVAFKRPATTDELAAAVALHRTGVRDHLERLQAAGLVERHRVPQARGRPRDAWSVSPDAELERRPDAYADLAAWLAGAMPSHEDALRDIEAAGEKLGRELAGTGPALPIEERLAATLATFGFRPRRLPDRRGRLCFELGNCPYRAAVRVNQPVVCTLHRGLTRGMLDVFDPRADLVEFVPRDPDEAGCRVEIER
jgi:predicted ArsR family transcriptional regulator